MLTLSLLAWKLEQPEPIILHDIHGREPPMTLTREHAEGIRADIETIIEGSGLCAASLIDIEPKRG